MSKVIITHNAGFFSCCSERLDNIVGFINHFKKIPDHVDSSKQFEWYKQNKNNADITFEYFKNYDNNSAYKKNKKINRFSLSYAFYKDTDPYSQLSINNDITIDKNIIDYQHHYQFVDYDKIKFETITPVMKKYFSPSQNIIHFIDYLERTYNLDYENICVLFYRGNDKITETELCSYDEYVTYAYKILEKNPKVKFLIQSDETEFIDYFSELFPHNSFYFKDHIRHMKKTLSTVDKVFKEQNHIFSKFYLAITIIMSKCKYIVCGSGNCSIWIMLYRGNADNVYQNLRGKWICP
jgi:hypothetical protein